MTTSRHWGVPGVLTEHQRRLREQLGLEVPRPPAPKATEKVVPGVVAWVCEKCGCTNARPVDGKRRAPCEFCHGGRP